MFSLEDMAYYIASLGIVEQEHIWIGKLQDKTSESIGVYPLKSRGEPHIPIGGLKNTDHDTRQFSILVHWNQDVVATEQAADALYRKIMDTRDVDVRGQHIMFARMLVPDPVGVGTDDKGIYEYVIETEIYFERNGE